MAKESVSLVFQEGNSNKFYNISIEEMPSSSGFELYAVPFTFGRMGTAGQSGFKVRGVSYNDAKKAYDKAVKEKTGKGYIMGVLCS